MDRLLEKPLAALWPPPSKNDASCWTLKSVLERKLPLKVPSFCSFKSNAILDSLASLTTSINESVSEDVVLNFNVPDSNPIANEPEPLLIL